MKEKKSEHKKLILKTLEDSAMDSRKFWNTILWAEVVRVRDTCRNNADTI